jgi:hypothetical protein
MAKNNKLYTFVLDFNGGIYISQKVAESPKEALIAWSEELSIQEIEGLGTKRKEKIINDAKQEEPTPIKDVNNVWCSIFLSGRNLAVVNFVQTDNGKTLLVPSNELQAVSK